jgi:hypothetical protein
VIFTKKYLINAQHSILMDFVINPYTMNFYITNVFIAVVITVLETAVRKCNIHVFISIFGHVTLKIVAIGIIVVHVREIILLFLIDIMRLYITKTMKYII